MSDYSRTARIVLGIEYRGSDFCGWQLQGQGRTVQGQLEQALARVADHPVRVICAGRTDTGVHAVGQVVHFDSPAPRPLRAWVFGANSHLPNDISVRWARAVDNGFHARFSAQRRHYRYIIYNAAVRPAILAGRVSWDYRPLEVSAMQAAAPALTGEHDFSSYRSYACQAKNPVRTVHRLDIRREGAFIVIDIVANAFLHHMVRNIAGVLMEIGSGRRSPDWAGEVLAACDRVQGGVNAPPHGLYFIGVEYPENYGMPYSADAVMFW